MKKTYMEIPVTFRLKASAVGLFMDEIAKLILAPLERDLWNRLLQYGLSFSCSHYAQKQVFSRDADFRYALLRNLLPEPPWDPADASHINSVLELNGESLRNHIRRPSLEYWDAFRFDQELSAFFSPAEIAPNPSDAFSIPRLIRFFQIELRRRVYHMLDVDVVDGYLKPGGFEQNFVSLDRLVEWASHRLIIIEQDPLGNCLPLVADSYSRLRQRLIDPIGYFIYPDEPVERDVAPKIEVTLAEPVSRAKAQDAAILAALASRRIDPKCFPKAAPGQAGAKAAVRAELTAKSKTIFQSNRVFDTAWQRLRDQGQLIDAHHDD